MVILREPVDMKERLMLKDAIINCTWWYIIKLSISGINIWYYLDSIHSILFKYSKQTLKWFSPTQLCFIQWLHVSVKVDHHQAISTIFTFFLNIVFMIWWWLTSTETCRYWIKHSRIGLKYESVWADIMSYVIMYFLTKKCAVSLK